MHLGATPVVLAQFAHISTCKRDEARPDFDKFCRHTATNVIHAIVDRIQNQTDIDQNEMNCRERDPFRVILFSHSACQ
ncbi:expressed protein [Echinococcus multilocularis]|uniref:Expressed protein n=1 Tax=Echinococcus multilocularis TaxID=6211 RepID=A0A068Y4Z9_ECHMU|nr:expressed protein [Echinococcus multilocularis]